MVTIDADVLTRIVRSCDGQRPDEACGLLAGRSADRAVTIHRSIDLANVWPVAAERSRRFAIDPLAQLRAERQTTAGGDDVVGFFHSHPNSAPVPSAFDRERAWPRYVYLIVGFDGQKEPTSRAWMLDDAGAFVEHSLHIDG